MDFNVSRSGINHAIPWNLDTASTKEELMAGIQEAVIIHCAYEAAKCMPQLIDSALNTLTKLDPSLEFSRFKQTAKELLNHA